MASFGSKLVRESVFVSELEQEFTSRLGLSCSESSLSPSVASNLGLWLAGIGLHDYESLFLESGFDDIDFIVSTFYYIGMHLIFNVLSSYTFLVFSMIDPISVLYQWSSGNILVFKLNISFVL